MHHIQSIIFSFLFTHLFVFSKAQAVGAGGWLMLANTYKINKSFTGFFDAQFRSSHQFDHLQTIILRPGLQYNISKTVNATLGYALVKHHRAIGNITGYAPEHRIWQQLQIMHPLGKTTLNHRLRLEQRFTAKSMIAGNSLHHYGNTYSNRFRYFARDIIPFHGSKPFRKGAFGALQNEIFINIGDKSAVNGKLFDQNRAYCAIGYRFSQQFDLEAGYLNQYIAGQNRAVTNNHNIQVASYIRL